MTAPAFNHPAAVAAPDIVWWKGAVIYQIYPRSFADSNGDGIGDLKGITAHLDHVAALGVDGVWISPFFKSPMKDFGYDVADYCDVDPIFGTLADFDALLARAHALGLKVIIDQVYSHTSAECEWFKESRSSRDNPKADWYVWANAKADGTPPTNWLSVFAGPAWTWDAGRRQYYLHNFLSSQPDLNLHNPDVQEAVLATARFWLDRGVDGFRLDATNFYMHDPELRDNPPYPGAAARESYTFNFQEQCYNQSHPDILPFIERYRALLDSYSGDRFTVAEIGGRRAIEEMSDYTKGNNRLSTAYSFIFLESPELSAGVIRKALSDWDAATDAWPSWTFSNHDRPRTLGRWGKEADPATFARTMNMLLLSLRGTIFLYQGEELGLPQADVPFNRLQDPEALANWPKTLGRDGTRTPMPWKADTQFGGWSCDPWLPLDPRHISLAADVQTSDPTSTLAFTKALLSLRRSHPALRVGGHRFLDTPEPILAFTREADGETLLCVFNLSNGDVRFEGETGTVLQTSGTCDPATGAMGPFSGWIVKL
ncbi:alpha-glucosidase family protein [Gimibacter soli]|uniref:Alpha-glucosidase family protein n=1 Tax=Gimibacter soli TaxID=3024400 RepID=A0AAE9XW53_9PROT|nr:alpha-glucosidase family protein [Gimibacter soli]WCL54279.1 alpha-glucosidase family protein [Gimibacter soli]